MLIAGEDGAGIALKETNHLTAAPAAVLLHQPPWHFVVRQRHQRGDVVRRQFVKQLVVKGQPRFVRLLLVTVREDTRPGNGDAQAAEAHFGEQFDVFRVAMVEIDRHVFDAAVTGDALNDLAKHALRLNVRGGEAFAIFQISAFYLIRGNRAAPQEIIWESFH
ncbi:hypothetical protein D3C75_307490 [compost metagenome]